MTEVRVFVSADAAATAAAEDLINAIADAQAGGQVPDICLTGGTMADLIHREVARLGAASAVDWTAVEFWWGDERYVETASADRNAGQAQVAFLDVLGVPARRVHAMPSTGSSCSVDEGARAYTAELARRSDAPFLVTMLGVGPDGHVASLFPGFPQLQADGVSAVAVTGSPKPPPSRISLTLEALNRSTSVWLVASGAAKAAAVAAALAGGDLPAARVRGQRDTIWFLDQDAAADLS